MPSGEVASPEKKSCSTGYSSTGPTHGEVPVGQSLHAPYVHGSRDLVRVRARAREIGVRVRVKILLE